MCTYRVRTHFTYICHTSSDGTMWLLLLALLLPRVGAQQSVASTCASLNAGPSAVSLVIGGVALRSLLSVLPTHNVLYTANDANGLLSSCTLNHRN